MPAKLDDKSAAGMDHAIDDDEGRSLKQLGKKLQILEKVRSGRRRRRKRWDSRRRAEYGRKMENFALVDKCCSLPLRMSRRVG